MFWMSRWVFNFIRLNSYIGMRVFFLFLGFFFSFCPLLLKCAFRRWEEKSSFWKRFCEYLTKHRMQFAFMAVFLQRKQRHSSETFLLWNYAITSLIGEKFVVKHLCVFLQRANSYFYRTVASWCNLVVIVEAHFWHQLKVN